MRILLVYYSWTGNTRKLAQRITSRLKCDVEEIYEKEKRKGKMNYLVGGFQALFGMKSRIEKPKRNPSDYDLVLLGGPVWNGRITPAVRSYLSDVKINDYACFFSTGRGGHEKSARMVAEIVGKKPKAILAVESNEIGNADISGFMERLKAKSP